MAKKEGGRERKGETQEEEGGSEAVPMGHPWGSREYEVRKCLEAGSEHPSGWKEGVPRLSPPAWAGALTAFAALGGVLGRTLPQS